MQTDKLKVSVEDSINNEDKMSVPLTSSRSNSLKRTLLYTLPVTYFPFQSIGSVTQPYTNVFEGSATTVRVLGTPILLHHTLVPILMSETSVSLGPYLGPRGGIMDLGNSFGGSDLDVKE